MVATFWPWFCVGEAGFGPARVGPLSGATPRPHPRTHRPSGHRQRITAPPRRQPSPATSATPATARAPPARARGGPRRRRTGRQRGRRSEGGRRGRAGRRSQRFPTVPATDAAGQRVQHATVARDGPEFWMNKAGSNFHRAAVARSARPRWIVRVRHDGLISIPRPRWRYEPVVLRPCAWWVVQSDCPQVRVLNAARLDSGQACSAALQHCRVLGRRSPRVDAGSVQPMQAVLFLPP